MKSEMWLWVYEGVAHGFFDSRKNAMQAAHSTLHWTRHDDVLYVTFDEGDG